MRVVMDGKILIAGAVVAAAAAGGAWWVMTPHATEAEAAALQAKFDAVLSPKATGLLTVTAAGDHYRLHIDPAAVIPKEVDGKPLQVAVSSYDLDLREEAEGLWQFEAAPQPFKVSFRYDAPVPANSVSFEYAAEGMQVAGSFSEAMQFFTRLDSKIASSQSHQTQPGEGGETATVTVATGPAESQMSAVMNPAAQGIDLTSTIRLDQISETVLVKPATGAGTLAPAAGTSFVLRAETTTSDTTLTGLRWREMLPLFARVQALATAGKDPSASERAEIAKLAMPALPLFERISGTSSLSGVSIETPVGKGGLEKMGVEVEMTGAVAKGKLREAITAEGPSLPPGLVPAWAEALVPQKLRLDFGVEGFDLAGAAKVALDEVARGTGVDSPDIDARLEAALLPGGALTFALYPSFVGGTAYKLDADARLGFDLKTETPTDLAATLKLAGLDAILTALQQAPEDMRQGAMGLMMARGLAKVEADGSLTWAFAMTPDKSTVTVNGTSLGALGGVMP